MGKNFKIDFKQPKYIIPIMVFVFANFMFYVFSSMNSENTTEKVVIGADDLQLSLSDASTTLRQKDLDDKFDAYKQHYNFENREKQISAINKLETEAIEKDEFQNLYDDDERARIELEQQQLKEAEDALRRQQAEIASGGYTSQAGGNSSNDDVLEMLKLINAGNESDTSKQNTQEPSALELMKEQYRFLDSLERATNPELQMIEKEEERQRLMYELMEKDRLSKLTVSRVEHNKHFNTIIKDKKGDFIKAIIDENVTGYAGSRIKIRLLEPIKVGNYIIDTDTYLYALITGFNEQRVRLNIVSIMHHNNILPINLSIYDVDGMEGLYVPSSQFREFTKELGGNSIQGMNLNTATGDMKQQFFTSLIDRAFTSTSSSISRLIRQNKAKLKYNTFVYLIDRETLDQTREMIYKQNTNN
ncbi:MAG: conjugative transposon protein TraM [Bacteroidia bacterium]|nr:conjugative transposon protein TraM [Bacteroidia bacterium]